MQTGQLRAYDIDVMPTLVDIAPAPAQVADLVAAGLVRAVDVMHAQLRTSVGEVEQLVRLAERYHGKMLRPAISMGQRDRVGAALRRGRADR